MWFKFVPEQNKKLLHSLAFHVVKTKTVINTVNAKGHYNKKEERNYFIIYLEKIHSNTAVVHFHIQTRDLT